MIVDDEIFSILNKIIIDGHDGAHPHLPPLNNVRAQVLKELIEDILYYIYKRKGKLKEAQQIRTDQINKSK